MMLLRAGSLAAHPAARWWILFGLWLVYGSFGLVVVSIAPLVAPIQQELSMSHTAIGSIMGAWQLVYIGAAIPCGMLLDRIGGRLALLLGVALVALSVLGRALAVDYFTFLLAVMVFGLGGPIISSGAPKMVAELFSGSQRGLAMGVYMTGPALGGVIALALTNSWLMPLLDMQWRWVMGVWAVCALLAGVIWMVIAWLYVPAATPVATNAARPSQLATMLELVRMPAVQVLLVMSTGVFLFNHGLNNWLVELLRHGGMSATTAGYWATLPTLVGIVASLVLPRLATPERRFLILGALCIAALLACVLLRFQDPVPLTAGLLVQGLARATLMTVLILTLVELPGIGEARAGVASGMFFSAAEIGGVLGPLGIGVMFDLSGGFDSSLNALAVVASLLALGCVVLKRLANAPQR